MKFIKSTIPDVIICEPTVFGDHRGYFMESFKQQELNAFLGYNVSFTQDNESMSTYGVMRGMHYQKGTFSQSKLVRVIAGKVLDVVVDLRADSATFKQVFCIELSAENKRQLFVPKGFAHGYIVLSDAAIFHYKVDVPYAPENEAGFMYNDASLKIDWQIPQKDIIVSEKDLKQPEFKFASFFKSSKNLYV